MREYNVIITEDNNGVYADIISPPIHFTGENNATELIITLNEELTDSSIEYYTLAFSIGFKNKNCEHLTALSDVITAESSPGYISDGVIHYPLRGALTCFSSLGCQVEAHTSNNEATIKSPVFEIKFIKSIIADSLLCDMPAYDLKQTLLSIENRLHTHAHPKTLESFSCHIKDNDIVLNYEGNDRPQFDRYYLRYVEDGAVITGTTEIEKDGKKYLRINLNDGVAYSYGFWFIDIPIYASTEVSEESGGITTNGTELDFGIPEADLFTAMDKFETDATALTLSPNTVYSFGEAATLDITLGEETEGKYNEYMFSFISGETATVLTLPDTVVWVNELTVEANKRYEISIVDNIALWCATDYTAEVSE